MRALLFFFFFFNDTATTEIYTLSLHDALPIFSQGLMSGGAPLSYAVTTDPATHIETLRSEEHTSELQSRQYLVCRLLLEKKKDTEDDAAPEALADAGHGAGDLVAGGATRLVGE